MIDFSDAAARPFMELIPYPVFVLDAQGCIRAVNEASCRHFGVEATRLLGRKGLDMTAAKPHVKRFKAWLEGRVVPTRLRWRRKSGVETFLVFPARIEFAGQPAVVTGLLPVEVISAALGMRGGRARGKIHARAQESDVARSGLREIARDGDPELAKLTPREWEIARRIAEGDRVATLAEDLRIATNTIRNHLKSIFRKLRIRSQTELVRRVKRRRI